MAGMSMVVPFLPFYIRELGVTDPSSVEKWSGLVFAGPFVFSFLLTPVWGALGDKYGKKPMVIRAITGLALSQFLIGISGNVYHLLLFRLFQGAASGFIASALALVSSSSPQEKSGYSIGVLQTSLSTGTIIGPLLGGFFADIASYRAVFFVTASLCFVSGVLVVIFAKEPQTVNNNKKAPNVFENYRYSFRNPVLRKSLILITLVQMSIAITQPIFALFVEAITENKEYISTIAGSLFGIMGIATAVSSPWWGRRNDTRGTGNSLVIAMLGAGIALFLHSLMTNAAFIFPLRILLGFCAGGLVPAFYSVINRNIDEGRKSGVLGIASSFTLLGNMIGPLICTMLTFAIDIRYIFIVSGSMLMLGTLAVSNIRIEAAGKQLVPEPGKTDDK